MWFAHSCRYPCKANSCHMSQHYFFQSPSEDSLYQRLVDELHSHDLSNGIAAVTRMAMFIAPGAAENLEKPTN